MRRSSLSRNEFARIRSQCPTGDLHSMDPQTDWADLLRSLLDVPIAVVWGQNPFEGPGARQSAGLGQRSHGGANAGVDAADGPIRRDGASGCTDRGASSVLVETLCRLMQPDGMTIIPDLRMTDTRSEALARARTWGVRSLAGFLFSSEGESGIVCVMDRRRRGYTVGELEVIQRVAEILRAHKSLSRSISNATATLGGDDAVSARDTLLALRDLLSTESECPTQQVVESLAGNLGACALEVHERAGQRGMLRLSAAVGQPSRLLGRRTARMGACRQAAMAMRTGRPVMSEDLNLDCGYMTSALLRRIGVRRGISIPIGDAGEPVGVISAYWAEAGMIPTSVLGLLNNVADCLGAVAEWREAQDGLCRRLGDPAWVGRNLGRHVRTAALDGRCRMIATGRHISLGGNESIPIPDDWDELTEGPTPLLAGSLLGRRSRFRDVRAAVHAGHTDEGDESWYRLIYVPMPDDSRSGCRAMLLQMDITDRVVIHRLLDAPERLFSGAGSSSKPQAVAVVDVNGIMIEATGDWPWTSRLPIKGVAAAGLDPIFPNECDCGRDTCIRARAELSRGIRSVAAGAGGGLELEFVCGSPSETHRIRSRIEKIPIPGKKLAAVGLWDVTPSEGDEDGPGASAAAGRGQRPAGSSALHQTGSASIEQGMEEKIAHLNYHDGITGLPNQTLARDRLDLAMLRARRSGRHLGLLLLDLDRFKVLNDSLGRQAGDQLLRLVGRRLVHAVRKNDTVARLGDDEFLILLPELERAEEAAQTASRILEAMKQPFHLGGREAFVTGSIGVSLYPASGDDAETLIKDADIAMYKAKSVGGNRHEVFSQSMTSGAHERFGLEADLHQAIKQNEFEVFYQPLFDMDSGIIFGVEALVRWRHPLRGLILPDAFISVAEETGLIVPIGQDVFRKSFRDIRSLQQDGHPGLRLSVNVSLRQFHQAGLVNQVEKILQETGMNPDEVSLEITESVAMCPMVSCANTLHGLKTLGFRMSLDDFGQGHSSLNRLKRLPIDSIKIDRAFIRRITLDQRDAAITRAMITMAHSLDMDVTAEGVEECEQLEFLRREGCDSVQGFLLSRPVPLEDLKTMLVEGKRIAEPA